MRKEKFPFLDVLLYKKGKDLHTNIFYKETYAHQYLHFKLCHPKHIKQNIPYSLEQRICSIVSKPEISKNKIINKALYLKE